MLVLGIETSGRRGSVALCRDGTSLAERFLSETGRRHAATLVSETAKLLRQAGLSPGDCDAVAVSIGPGSFTGLRVGVVFAKTFAYVTGCKLAAVDTFRAIAAACPDDVSNVVVVSDAQRRELFVGRYRKDKNVECGERSTEVRVPNFEFGQGCWKRLGDIEIHPLDVWCAERDPGDVVTGPGVDSDEQEIASVCRVLHPDFRHPTARQVARLGEQQLIAGLEADVWTLEPFYLRKSAAEEKRQAAATGTNT